MINEKELRTGNLYITLRNQIITVSGIDTVNKFVIIASTSNTEITSKNESSIIFEDLNSIEITEKNIAQLGFSTSDATMSINLVSDNKFRFVWNEKLSQVFLVDEKDGAIGLQIKYIHQLQNIFYDLSGKELTLV